MYKLIMFCVYDPASKKDDYEFELPDEFETVEQAELRALRWLSYRPNDLVMLVHIETDVCKNCGRDIIERIGWVVHRWCHVGGYMACLPDGATQAEPA